MRRENLFKVGLICSLLFLLCLVFDFGKSFLITAFIGLIIYQSCDLALQTSQHWNSDVLLERYYVAKHFFTTNSNIPTSTENPKNIKTGTNEQKQSSKRTENNVDSSKSIGDEISKLKSLFWQDFVKSWYTILSEYSEGCVELQSTLDEMVTNALHRIEKVEKYPLIIKAIQLYSGHLQCFQTALTKTNIISKPDKEKMQTIIQLFNESSVLHPVLCDEKLEHRYLVSVSRFMLIQLNKDEVDKCYPVLESLSEIIAHNGLLPLINMMCDTNWIHRMLINVLSDEEISLVDTCVCSKHTPESPNTDPSILKDKELFDVKTDDVIDQLSSNKDDDGASQSTHRGSLNKSVRFGLTETGDLSEFNDQVSERVRHFSDIGMPNKSAINAATHQEGFTHRSFTTPDLEHYFYTPSTSSIPPSQQDSRSQSISGQSQIESIQDTKSSSDKKMLSHKSTTDSQLHSQNLNISEHSNADQTDIMRHNIKSAYFSKLGLASSSPPRQGHDASPDTWSLASSASSNSSLPHNTILQQDMSQNASAAIPSILPLTMIQPAQWIALRSTSASSDPGNENSDTEQSSSTLSRPNMLNISPINKFAPTGIDSVLNFESPFEEVDIATEYMKITVPLSNTRPFPLQSRNHSLTVTEPVMELEKPMRRRQSEPKLLSDVPKLLFKTIVVSDCKEMKEPNSTSTYILYLIEYVAWFTDEGGELVVGPGFAHRRYREFINLQSRLEENPIYKRSIKGIKGPTKWFTFPILDKARHVEKRRNDLQLYLEKLLQKEEINCSADLREFLAYGGDAHIAFVKKAPELNVPRIDKLVARKMTVVKDRLSTALPTSDPDQGTRKRKPTKLLKVEETGDVDSLSLDFCYQNEDDTNNDSRLKKELETNQETVMADGPGVMADIGPREAADGSDDPDVDIQAVEPNQAVPTSSDSTKTSGPFLTHKCGDDLKLVSAILDLAAQAANGSSPLITDQVLNMFKTAGGKALESWLHKEIDELTTPERCAYYLSLLREVIWPGGVLDSTEELARCEEQLELTKQQALRCLKQFFPDILPFILEHDFDIAVKQVLDSVEYQQLNRHFIYCLLDLLLEELFPEITVPNFGQLALLKDPH